MSFMSILNLKYNNKKKRDSINIYRESRRSLFITFDMV